MSGWISSVSEISRSRQDHVIVTLVDIVGSAPQVVSSKMIVTTNGLYSGTVGGGKIEAHCIEYAKELLTKNSPSQLKTWNLQKDIGMSCGGEVSLFFDCNFFSNWTVAIFGAGHISQELCRVMQTWSCQVKVFDNRKEWIEKLPESTNIEKNYVDNLSSCVQSLPKNTYLLSMTQGHDADLPVLEQALREHQNFAFIGVIGSNVKGQKIKKELKDRGISLEAIERLACPLGLDFGNNTPPEISISIAAQLLSLQKEKGAET